MKKLVEARAKRWFHLWRCMWTGGIAFTGYNDRKEVVIVACTCGRVFWTGEQ
jgi:hypothetical protein